MTTAVATKPPNAIQSFSTFLDRYKPQIALALPKSEPGMPREP